MQGLNAAFERMRGILHEGAIDKRVQYMIEQVRFTSATPSTVHPFLLPSCLIHPTSRILPCRLLSPLLPSSLLPFSPPPLPLPPSSSTLSPPLLLPPPSSFLPRPSGGFVLTVSACCGCQLYAKRRNGFAEHPGVLPELDLVEAEDQITHEFSLDDKFDLQACATKDRNRLAMKN